MHVGFLLVQKLLFDVFQIITYLFKIRVRKNLRTHVGDIDVAAVPCGFGRAIGNKVWFLIFKAPVQIDTLLFAKGNAKTRKQSL